MLFELAERAVRVQSSVVRVPAGGASVPTAPAGSSADRLTSRLAAAATAPRAAPANGAAESDGGSFEATRGARDAECAWCVGSSRSAVPSWFDAEMDTDGAMTSPRDAGRTVARRASRDAARGRRHVATICGRAETVSGEDGAARRGAPRGTPRAETRAFGTMHAAETIMVCSCVTVRRVVSLARTRPRWKCLETRETIRVNVESFPRLQMRHAHVVDFAPQ